MKKKSFYVWAMMMVAMLCVGFTSCNDDDDDDNNNTVTGQGLVGTWQLVSTENYYHDGSKETVNMLDYEKYFALYVQFKADGTVFSYEYDEGEWDVESNTYVHQNDYIITYIEDGEVNTVKVRTLNSTTLEVEVTDDLDDESVKYMIQTFKRVSDSKVKDAIKK